MLEKGGEPIEFIFLFYYFCYGKSSCLLHLQMAGQKVKLGNRPEV